MTTYEKVAISLPARLLADARAAVASGEAASLSGYVAEALAARQRRDALDAVLLAMTAESDEPTEEDRAWVQQVLAR